MADKVAKISKIEKVDTAHVLISRTCVNDCLFCATAVKRQKKQFPDKRDILQFIDKSYAQGIAHLIFSGLGEPTLDPNFETYLERAGKCGFATVRLFTNGHNISDEKASRWKALGLTDVLLSIHGMKTGHDYLVRRSGAFDQAIAALKIFTELNYTVSVNTCLALKNTAEIKPLIAFLKPIPIKIHTLAFPEWCGNVLNNSDEMIDYLQAADIADILPEADDDRTCFDNLPYCLVQKRTIEQRGRRSAAYLDGGGENIVRPISRKQFHHKCREFPCRFLSRCSGFEPEYIKIRGWGNIPDRIKTFLSSQNHKYPTEIKERDTSRAHVAQSLSGSAAPDYYHKDQLTIIIRPTNNCNADCVYCSSYNPRKANGQMAIEMLDEIFHKIHSYIEKTAIENLCLLWHGGEPLLAGKEFYASAWEIPQEWDNVKVKHLIQTNLLLVDQDWLSLFKKYDVGIGTSADPIENIRVYKNGQEQYNDWIDKLLMVSRNGMNVGIVFTATAVHLKQIERLHYFFKNIQLLAGKSIGFKVNPLYAAGKMMADPISNLSLSPQAYGEFLAGLWDLWERDRRPYPLSPFREWLEPGKLSCEFSGKCQENFLAIDQEGNVFNCARFADSNISFGNLLNDDMEDILQHKARLELVKRQTRLQTSDCAGCGIWSICHGGCPYFAEIYEGAIGGRTAFCDSYKYLFKTKPILDSAISRNKK